MQGNKSMRLPLLRYSAVVGVLFALSVLVSAAQQRPAPTAEGVWEQLNEDGKVGSWFQIYERGNGIYEGKIVKMFPRPGEKPNPVCAKCTGEQKNQPTLGMTLIKGMQRKGRNYENGTILDPRDGSVYNARMELSPDGQKLMLRGYLGIDLFGQSQIWRRLPDTALNEITGAVTPQAASTPPPPVSGKPPTPASTKR
jgi:uncharacterized protein (DUF2147 family)